MRRHKAVFVSHGFTLIELIMVMMILGLVASVTLVFMQRTISGYGQARDRLLLAEQARLALNRFKREAHLSLPNSARLTTVGGVYYLEFVPVVSAGRYRVGSANGSDIAPLCPIDSSSVPDNGVLTIGLADSCFKTLGVVDTASVAVGDWLVIFNAGSGYAALNFYESGAVTGGNKSALVGVSSSATETRLAFDSNAFSWDTPGHRFYVAKNPISYVCDPVSKQLTRWSGYSVSSVQPTSGLSGLSGATSASLLKKVNSCQISYAPASIASQYGLITMNITLATDSGDPLSLQVQSLVSNLP